MVPNHGGDTIESILGPMGSHWVQKMGRKREKLPCPNIRIHRFFAKNGSYGYGAKSQRGHHRVHLGANGVPLGPKNGSKTSKITMPQNSNFRFPHGHRFFPKNRSYGYGAKSRRGPPRVHLGAVGSHWVRNCANTVKNYHAPKCEFSITPRSSVCRKKWNLRL